MTRHDAWPDEGNETPDRNSNGNGAPLGAGLASPALSLGGAPPPVASLLGSSKPAPGRRRAPRPICPVAEVPLFPKPEPKLSPNTYAFESQPMVKPTGFREYDARWLFEQEINLMGAQALGLGLARLLKELGVRRGDRRRPRLPQLFGFDQAGVDRGADGRRRACARHRARADADGLFRPVRSGYAGGRDGDRLPQRQRLDRGQDGRGEAGDLRAGGDGAPARHRHRRRLRSGGGRRV